MATDAELMALAKDYAQQIVSGAVAPSDEAKALCLVLINDHDAPDRYPEEVE